jgi:hypothetical protein
MIAMFNLHDAFAVKTLESVASSRSANTTEAFSCRLGPARERFRL